MKICIYSPDFFPISGGISTIVSILAEEFHNLGHTVIVITTTADPKQSSTPYQVIRQPKRMALLRAVQWCDIYVHFNVSLKGVWPLLISRKPWIISHQGLYARGIQTRLKSLCMRFAHNISCSEGLARYLPVPSTVIHNTYQANVFHENPDNKKIKDLIFVGRLVSEKGADLLISAIEKLHEDSVHTSLTIVGSGPDESSLRTMVHELRLDSQITFVGEKKFHDIARLLRMHRILVVPSRVKEGFGIVALEGIACGCMVIGSEGGGLREAIGPCGITFPNNNREALIRALKSVLLNHEAIRQYRAPASDHLRLHQPSFVAQKYISVFEQVIKKRKY